jgi:hypothetical protein
MDGAIYGAPAGDPANYNGEDRYGLGWVELWVMFFGAQLWLALGGMLLSAARSGRMPIWACGWVMILRIAAAITVWVVLQVYIDSDGGVSIVVPTLLPLLIAGYAAAMGLPALSKRLSARPGEWHGAPCRRDPDRRRCAARSSRSAQSAGACRRGRGAARCPHRQETDRF